MAEETVTKPTSASIIQFPQRTCINPAGKTASTPSGVEGESYLKHLDGELAKYSQEVS